MTSEFMVAVDGLDQTTGSLCSLTPVLYALGTVVSLSCMSSLSVTLPLSSKNPISLNKRHLSIQQLWLRNSFKFTH